MDAVTSNGPNLYAYLARRMRVALGEFDDTNRDLEGLVKELAEFKRAHLAQPAQSVDVRSEDLQIEMFPPDPGGMRVYRPRGVKVTHKPTGITVACVHERSQHANRDTALRALTAALTEKGNG